MIQYSRFAKKSKWTVRSGMVIQKMVYTLQNLVSGQGYQYAINSHSAVFSLYNKAGVVFYPSQKSFFKFQYAFNFHHVSTIDRIKNTGYNQNQKEHKLLIMWQQAITNHLSATLLLRNQLIDGKILPLVPFFGFDWSVSKTWKWKIQGNVARNVHYPALNDLYWQPGGNPDLKPEEGLASEVHSTAVFKVKKFRIVPELSLFYNDIQGWILWLPAPAGYWEAQNIQKVVARGMTFTMKIAFTVKQVQCKVIVNYGYTRSENYGNPAIWGEDAIGKQLPYIPLHSGNISMTLRWKGFNLLYVNNSYSERFTTSTNNLTRRDWLYPYFMNNLYLSKLFVTNKLNINVQGKVYNLFNEEYRSVLGRPMPGRNFLLEIVLTI